MIRPAGALLVGLAVLVLFRPSAAAGQEFEIQPRGGAVYAPCSILSQNRYTRDVFSDIYLWDRFLPDVKPWRFASPEAYLEAVRYRPLDSSFSAIAPRAAYTALFSDSQYVGFGFSTRQGEADITVLQVFPGSPADEAALARGDRIVAIDGRTVQSLVASGTVGSALGPEQIGFALTADVVGITGEPKRVTLRKRVVTIPPVALMRTFLVDGRVVGYLHFRQFVRPAAAALDEAFAALRQAGATELVLDLRYNGGGLLDVAQQLASLIGDASTRGQVFARAEHNDRNASRNTTLRFDSALSPLRLTRLIAITTRASASASELVINGLRPYMPVVVIGERTYGKPVGQYGFEHCDRVLLPVSFRMVNALGQGDYFDGIAADCSAIDDVAHELGMATEASLAEAIHVIRTGGCSDRTTGPARQTARRFGPAVKTGWQQMLNAQ
jgi:C-terminal peptidase prc